MDTVPWGRGVYGGGRVFVKSELSLLIFIVSGLMPWMESSIITRNMDLTGGFAPQVALAFKCRGVRSGTPSALCWSFLRIWALPLDALAALSAKDAFKPSEVIPSLQRWDLPDCSPSGQAVCWLLRRREKEKRMLVPLHKTTKTRLAIVERNQNEHCRFKRHTLSLWRSSCPHPQPIAVRACELNVGH